MKLRTLVFKIKPISQICFIELEPNRIIKIFYRTPSKLEKKT